MIRKVPDDDATKAAEQAADDEAPEAVRRGAIEAGDEQAADEQATDDEPSDAAEEAQASDDDAPAEASADEAGDDQPADGDGDDDAEAPSDRPRVGQDLPLPDRVEALLFATGQPLAARRLGQLLGEDVEAVKEALAALQTRWDERDGAIDLVEIANGFRFMTRPLFADVVGTLVKKKGPERLSPAALETLAVVAYRQPIGRADIESVRGVQCGPLLRVLLDRDLIRVAGKSPEPGHPLLYGTTKRFLDHFGLRSLKALPDISDLLETS